MLVFMYNPYLLKDVILVIHKIVSSQDIWMWKVHCWKKQNKIAKHFKLFFSGTIEKTKKIAHDTIQWLNYVVNYLNMK